MRHIQRPSGPLSLDRTRVRKTKSISNQGLLLLHPCSSNAVSRFATQTRRRIGDSAAEDSLALFPTSSSWKCRALAGWSARWRGESDSYSSGKGKSYEHKAVYLVAPMPLDKLGHTDGDLTVDLVILVPPNKT